MEEQQQAPIEGTKQEPCLVGWYDHTLDEKGRVTLPARYAPLYVGDIYISPSLHGEPCAYVYYEAAWRGFDEKYLKDLDEFTDAKANRRVSRLLGATRLVRKDKQNRIVVPQDLIDRLGLSGTVRLVGHRDRLELWTPESHDAWLAEDEEE